APGRLGAGRRELPSGPAPGPAGRGPPGERGPAVTDARAHLGLVVDRFRKDGRSLLQYASEAFPWTTANNHFFLDKLHRMAEEERQALRKFYQFLVRHHVTPPILD